MTAEQPSRQQPMSNCGYASGDDSDLEDEKRGGD
jgi:hypothetical protein